jgi:HSP20 family protein
MELWIDSTGDGDGLWRHSLPTLFREAGRRLDDGIVPATDVIEDAEGYRFYFEMPGLTSDSIDVRVEDGSLVVEAERKRPEWPKDAGVHRAERRYGKICRSFRLPEDANAEEVHAAYRDGVLEVNVGKRPEAKPVRVKVAYEN